MENTLRLKFSFFDTLGYLPMPAWPKAKAEWIEERDQLSVALDGVVDDASILFRMANELTRLKTKLSDECGEMQELCYHGDPHFWLDYVMSFVKADAYGEKAVFISCKKATAFVEGAMDELRGGLDDRWYSHLDRLIMLRNKEEKGFWKKRKGLGVPYVWDKEVYRERKYEKCGRAAQLLQQQQSDEKLAQQQHQQRAIKAQQLTQQLTKSRIHRMKLRWETFETKEARMCANCIGKTATFASRHIVAREVHGLLQSNLDLTKADGPGAFQMWKRALFLETMIYKHLLELQRLDVLYEGVNKVKKEKVTASVSAVFKNDSRCKQCKKIQEIEKFKPYYDSETKSKLAHTYRNCDAPFNWFPEDAELRLLLKKKTSELKKLRSKHCKWVTESAWAKGRKKVRFQLAFNWAILQESLIRRQVEYSLQKLYYLPAYGEELVQILPYFGMQFAKLDSFLYDVAPTMSAYANIAQTIDERIVRPRTPNSILDLIIVWIISGKYQPYSMLICFEGHSFDPDNFPRFWPVWELPVVEAKPFRFPSLRF